MTAPRVEPDPIPPLSPAASVCLTLSLAHAVGHDMGPCNYRNGYYTYGDDFSLQTAESLGLVSMERLGYKGHELFRVVQRGKEVLRAFFAKGHAANRSPRMRAFFVSFAGYDDPSDSYGDAACCYVIAANAGAARAAIWRDLEGCTWADVRVRRAYELDHRTPAIVADRERGGTLLFSSHARRSLFAGPWIGDLLDFDLHQRRTSQGTTP